MSCNFYSLFLDLGHYRKRVLQLTNFFIFTEYLSSAAFTSRGQTPRMELLCQKKRIFFNLNSYCQTASKKLPSSHTATQCMGVTVSLVPWTAQEAITFLMGKNGCVLTSILLVQLMFSIFFSFLSFLSFNCWSCCFRLILDHYVPWNLAFLVLASRLTTGTGHPALSPQIITYL